MVNFIRTLLPFIVPIIVTLSHDSKHLGFDYQNYLPLSCVSLLPLMFAMLLLPVHLASNKLYRRFVPDHRLSAELASTLRADARCRGVIVLCALQKGFDKGTGATFTVYHQESLTADTIDLCVG